MESHGARQRITRRRFRGGYGGGWMYGYTGFFGDREEDRDDQNHLGEQFDDVGGFEGGDGGGDGGGE